MNPVFDDEGSRKEFVRDVIILMPPILTLAAVLWLLWNNHLSILMPWAHSR